MPPKRKTKRETKKKVVDGNDDDITDEPRLDPPPRVLRRRKQKEPTKMTSKSDKNAETVDYKLEKEKIESGLKQLQSVKAGFQIALSANQIGPEGNLTNQSANCLAST